MKRYLTSAVILALGVILATATGCAEYQQYSTAVPQSPGDLTAVVTIFADAPPALKATAQAIAIERYATAQAAESAIDQASAAEAVARATREVAEAAAQRQYVAMTADAQGTAQAHERDLEQKAVWATQQSANATQCAQATAQAVSVQLTQQAAAIEATAAEWGRQTTATAQEWEHRATGTAEAVSGAATATAQQAAYQATVTAAAWEDRRTATAESWGATAQVAHATMTRQAEKRESTMGAVRDFGIPFVLLLAVVGLGVLIWYGFRELANRPQVIERSILGDAQPLALKDGRGGWNLIDLDRQPGHVTRLLASGEAQAPRFRSAEQEERTTARDQVADAMTRPRLGGGHSAHQAPALAEPPSAAAPGLRSVRTLRRLDQAARLGVLPPGVADVIDADWQEVEE